MTVEWTNAGVIAIIKPLMHELPITKSIMKSVIAKAEKAGAGKVLRVVIEAGELREFVSGIVQKYWDYLGAGTLCEGAQIELITIPASARCGRCGEIYRVNMENLMESDCPRCGFESGELVSGRELKIKGIEIS